MKFLGIIRSSFTLLIALLLADFTVKSHVPSALDYMDVDDITTIGPQQHFPAPCKDGCDIDFEEQETNGGNAFTAPADLDYMDDDITTIGPQQHFPALCKDGCDINSEEQETNGGNVFTGFCSSPPYINNAEINEVYLKRNVFPTGSIVRYTCQTGYSPSPGTNVTVTCLAGGIWSFGSLCKHDPIGNVQTKPNVSDSQVPGFCSSPPNIPFAELSEEFSKRTVFSKDTTVTLNCQPGYLPSPEQSLTATCLSDGTWTSNSVCSRICRSPPDIPYAKLKYDFFKDMDFLQGAIASYKCKPGFQYIPGTKEFVTCIDGKWSTNDVFCKPNSCGSPPRLDYGIPRDDNLERTLFATGTILSYSCRPGYIRIPGKSSLVTCQDDATWSVPNIFCKPNSCGSPPRLDYGIPKDDILERTLFDFGTKVSYSCRPGYIRIPGESSLVTCQNDATWSVPNIFCKRRSCGNPGEAENSQMQAESFDFGSRVTYTCERGYKMISKRNYRDCQADGTWSNAVPVCSVQFCPSPPRISNGHYYPDKEEYTYLDSIRYICSGNLALIGEYNIVCGEDGTWNSDAPECTSVWCPDPYVKNAYQLSGHSGPYYLNSAVRFRCRSYYNMQYTLIGSDTVKCNQNNQWEPELPKCLGMCLFPPRIKYAEIVEPTNETKFLEGTQLKYKCKEGYEFSPGAIDTITCSEFQWSPSDEFCTPKPCVEPESVPNGRIIDGLPLFGNRIMYACDIGYRMKNISYRECLSDQSWSLPIPECEVQTCPAPEWSNNGWCDPEEKQYYYKDTISFGCHEGFKLIGQDLITCNENGRWNYRVPECRGICKDPPTIEYAILNAEYEPTAVFVAGSTVQYKCRRGYIRNTMYTNYSITCLENSKWSNIPVDFCIRRSCGRPPRVENTVLEEKYFLFESEAVYKCEKGYKLESSINSITCQSNGRWNGTLPVCKVLKCSPPEDLENGSYSIKKNEYLYGETVTYKCNKFQLAGKASISCADEGKWSSGAPQCRDACTLPPELPFAEVDTKFSNTDYADREKSIQYKCRPGFAPVSGKDNKITCLENLKWSKYEVFCTPISCGLPRQIENGEMHSENFLFGSRVNYTCNSGYSMMSKRNYIECQADGTWSGKPPVCKEPVCDKIWELQEEARKCTSNPDEWIKYLQVQYLYLEIEKMKLDNEIKKKQLDATDQTSPISQKKTSKT